MPSIPAPSTGWASRATSPKPTVAIVNDEKRILQSLEMFLQGQGFTVRTYADTLSALELLDNPADVMLLDKTNPPLGGLELYRRIRARTTNPVIFMSAWAEELEVSLQQSGEPADGYIYAPYYHRQVEAKIIAVFNAYHRKNK